MQVGSVQSSSGVKSGAPVSLPSLLLPSTQRASVVSGPLQTGSP
jgi:hypothetical protein